MESSEQTQFRPDKLVSGESVYHKAKNVGSGNSEQQEPISFTSEEVTQIEQKRKVLSSLAYFIGKDFQIPVELNEPGGGWLWDFEHNVIKVDPVDLLKQPMDFLRYLISHEGGHRRISRTESIPLETWKQPGFSFMMNSIEDPRDDNFVAENYPKYREQTAVAHETLEKIESEFKQKATEELGQQPRFMRAGLEYIKQWYRERQGQDYALSEDLPKDVREVVEKTLAAASDSWWRYPSRSEADSSEDIIKQYADASYRINLERVWPEFQKLVAADQKDQELQQMLDKMQQGQSEEQGQGGSQTEQSDQDQGGSGNIPQELKNKLTSEEQQQLSEALDEAIERAEAGQANEGKGSRGENSPVDLDSLSEELKQKLQEYFDSLSDEQKAELTQKAAQAIKEFEEMLNEEMTGKLSDNPDKKADRESGKPKSHTREGEVSTETGRPSVPTGDSEELRKYRDMIRETLNEDADVYERYRREVLPVIEKLEQDLRELFVKRRAGQWESGFRNGKRIDIKRRIQERAKGVSAMESRAWEKRELPQEKDYAITLLADLSGSMQGEKIRETFKAVIALTEVLNRLSIPIEVLGFNDRIYEYQDFGQDLTTEMRKNMGGMLGEVNGSGANWNDDGWALEQASERLSKQKAKEKFLIVLSDGQPMESPTHPRNRYELSKEVQRVTEETDQKLVGLGIGPDTYHVDQYYPNSVANVNVSEMAEKLADLIREAIANFDRF